MTKKTVLFFVFQGFSEWETSYALAGIMKSNVYQMKTIALEKAPVTTQGGLCVLPDLDFRPEVDLADIDNGNTAMIILPSGKTWRLNKNNEIAPLIRHCVNHQIPVAASGDATLLLTKMGLLNDKLHTGNGLDCLYKSTSCSSPNTIITARDTGPLEFAKAIFEALDANEKSMNTWLQDLNYVIEEA